MVLYRSTNRKHSDFVQNLDKPSQSTFHGHYLDSKDTINKIKEIAKENILKSSKWYFSFLKRNIWLWNRKYDHNQLRITRVIECLRLLVSDDEANKFYEDVFEIIKDDNKINETSKRIKLNYLFFYGSLKISSTLHSNVFAIFNARTVEGT